MSNIPSIKKIEYILRSDVNDFKYQPGDLLDISSYITTSFTELNFHGQASLTSEAKNNDAGTIYEISSDFRIAGKDPAIIKTLTELANRPRIFRLTDVNGRQYLLGNTRNPAKFTFQDTNDGEATGFRGYNCTISWKSLNGIIYLA